MEDEKVKWRSQRKYTCKRNKGEHEYLEPTIKHKPSIRYNYRTDKAYLNSPELHPEYKYLDTELSIWLEAKCKHCGHIADAYMSTKIK